MMNYIYRAKNFETNEEIMFCETSPIWKVGDKIFDIFSIIDYVEEDAKPLWKRRLEEDLGFETVGNN